MEYTTNAYTTNEFSSSKNHEVSKNISRYIAIKVQLCIMLLFQSAKM